MEDTFNLFRETSLFIIWLSNKDFLSCIFFMCEFESPIFTSSLKGIFTGYKILSLECFTFNYLKNTVLLFPWLFWFLIKKIVIRLFFSIDKASSCTQILKLIYFPLGFSLGPICPNFITFLLIKIEFLFF